MREPASNDGPPAHHLAHDRADVDQIGLVRKVGQAVPPHNAVEFLLRPFLHFGVSNHRHEEGADPVRGRVGSGTKHGSGEEGRLVVAELVRFLLLEDVLGEAVRIVTASDGLSDLITRGRQCRGRSVNGDAKRPRGDSHRRHAT